MPVIYVPLHDAPFLIVPITHRERDFVPSDCLRHKEKSAGKDDAPPDFVPSWTVEVGRWFLRRTHIAIFPDPSVCIADFFAKHFCW